MLRKYEGGDGGKNFLRSPVATAYSGTGVFLCGGGEGISTFPLPARPQKGGLSYFFLYV